MKKALISIVPILAVLLILTACEDVATNVKMPPAQKKIVVQCFISPDDDTVKAMVTWSKPIIGTSVSADPEFIKNANVVLSDGIKTAALLWNGSDELYETQSGAFKIEAGKKYSLVVSLPDGRNVKANCEVPLNKNKTLVFTKADTIHSDWGNETNCKFKYSDNEATVKNYFRIDGKPVLDNPYQDYYVSGEFKEDTDLKSENIFEFIFYNDQSQPIEKVKAWLINCDYNYFQYHKTLQGAQNNFGVFTEPSIVYSNIEGGLGCFGAYNSYELEVDL